VVKGRLKSDMPTKLTTEILTAAVLGFEEQKRRIDTKIAELRATLSGGPANPAATPEATSRKRKKFSAAARRKMAQSQKLRWAKIRGESEPSAPATPEAPKPKRRISEEGMKRIIAATKKRWRLQKAKSATAKKAVTRKATAKKAAVKAAKSATAPAQAAREAAAQ
jgi:ribonuclease E